MKNIHIHVAFVISFLAVLGSSAPQYNFSPPQRKQTVRQPKNPFQALPQVVAPKVTQKPKIGYNNTPPPSYNFPSSTAPPKSYKPQKKSEMMPYDFEWGVDDPESGNKFSHVESNDGQKTQGEYSVLLPDGRTQIVKFYDDGWGFVAEVTFQ